MSINLHGEKGNESLLKDTSLAKQLLVIFSMKILFKTKQNKDYCILKIFS